MGSITVRPDIYEKHRSLFGDKTVKVVENTLKRGVGRLMVTISMDGPKEMHEQMRGLPGSWDRAIETFRRLRGIKRSNFQPVIGMTVFTKNADVLPTFLVDGMVAGTWLPRHDADGKPRIELRPFRRLRTEDRSPGIHLGAFGWVENLEPAQADGSEPNLVPSG